MALSLELVPNFVYDAVALGLAFALLGLGFTNRVNRAFALLLLMLGLGGVSFDLGNVAGLAGDVDGFRFWARMGWYFLLPVGLPLLYFLCLYPTPRPWLPRGWRASLPFLAGVALVDGAFAFHHEWLMDFATIPFETSPPFHNYFSGPLAQYTSVVFLVFAAAPLVVAREAMRGPAGARRRSAMLVSLGLAVWSGTYFTINNIVTIAQGVQVFIDPLILASTIVYTMSTLVLILLALPAYLVSAARRADDGTRRGVRRYVAVLAVASLCGLWPYVAPASLLYPVGAFFTGFWNLWLPMLVSYALLKHQLFDIDLKLKWTIKRGTVAGIILAVVFVVGQVAQNYLSSSYGLLFGGMAAGVLLFAITPLQRMAERVADVAMPGVKAASELSHPERAAVYAEQVKVAWQDLALTLDERKMLDRLRETLGLSREEASRIESEVSGAMTASS